MAEEDLEGRARDVRLNEFLGLSEQATEVVGDWLAPLLDQQRERRPNLLDANRRKLILGMIVANSLAACKDPRGPAVHYSRAASTYTGNSPYFPRWLSYRMLIGVVDGLLRAGLLNGRNARPTGLGDQQQSTFWATGDLIEGLRERGVSETDVELDALEAPTIILKGIERAGRKPLIRYAADPRIVELAATIRRYNLFLRRQQLTLWDGAPEGGGAAVATPAPFLRRIFNDGRWDRGGRFYGGWWQLLPAAQRRAIRINGAETVELDFSGFLPRAIYHREGLALEGDAYEIPAIRALADAHRLEWSPLRNAIKRMLSYMLNANTPRGRNRIDGLQDFPRRRMSLHRAYERIEVHHAAIANWFYAGRGIEIMNQESNVCEAILIAGAARGIPVLPIHDSFIVPAEHEDWLREAMSNAYFQEFRSQALIHRH